MSVLRITHFKGGDPAEMTAIATEAKKVWTRLGADHVSFRRYQSGPHMGEWLFVVRLPNWSAMGQAIEQSATDPAYQATLARALKISTVLSVDFLAGADL